VGRRLTWCLVGAGCECRVVCFFAVHNCNCRRYIADNCNRHRTSPLRCQCSTRGYCCRARDDAPHLHRGATGGSTRRWLLTSANEDAPPQPLDAISTAPTSARPCGAAVATAHTARARAAHVPCRGIIGATEQPTDAIRGSERRRRRRRGRSHVHTLPEGLSKAARRLKRGERTEAPRRQRREQVP
jgi:hypothetical protein